MRGRPVQTRGLVVNLSHVTAWYRVGPIDRNSTHMRETDLLKYSP